MQFVRGYAERWWFSSCELLPSEYCSKIPTRVRGDFARWRKETPMNETVADGVRDYKLKRSGEPTGFMKRFKETPLVIVAARVRARARRTCIAAKK